MHRKIVYLSGGDIEVVKLGGSLLAQAGVRDALIKWLDRQQRRWPERHFVLVVGGGPLVDALRQWDVAAPLGDEAAHWLAIDLMQLTGRVVADWLSCGEVCETFADLRHRCESPGVTLFLPSQFLRKDEPAMAGRRLEASWRVTSDSIAARLAICLGAGRLRLLKSRAPTTEESRSWKLAARDGLVDAYFPLLAVELSAVICEAFPPTSDELRG